MDIPKYTVDRKVAGPVQVAGVRTKRSADRPSAAKKRVICSSGNNNILAQALLLVANPTPL